MERSDFQDQLAQLHRSVETDHNQESLEIRGSVGCVRCHFCADCTNCYACTYTTDSKYCIHCNRIDSCERCSCSSHLQRCVDCHDSQYLAQCSNCVECTYCIGCVGLTRKEFHILNQPYDRKTFFKIAKGLGIKYS